LEQAAPGDGLPDAIFFLAHGWRLRALLGMLEQQLRESLHSGREYMPSFDVMMSV
jgi:hypothetical protein